MMQIRERKKHNRGNLVSWCALFFVLPWVLMTVTTGLVQAEILIPKQSDWTDQGIAFTKGPTGSWDMRLGGSITPCTVVKKEGTYFLYYIGADGDRSTDGGPRHRALGVATSSDGINFTKYSENPILAHLPHNNEEEGIFSGGAALDVNKGNIILYYGAMDAGSATSVSVDGDIRLAVSSDCFNFTEIGDVVSHSDSSVWGYGDELFPVGTFQANGQWYVYYIAKGYGASWDLGLAWGPSADDLPNTQAVLTSGSYIIGGCDPLWVAPDKIALFVVRDFNTRIVEIRTASSNLPEQLSEPVETYDFNDFKHMTIFLDRDTSTGFMYYLNGARDAIRVRTAPMTDTIPPTTTPVITPTQNETGWNNVTQVVVTFFRADNGTGISYTNYSKTSETGPWTTVGTSTAMGPDAVNVTDIHEGNFNVTVLKEGLTEIWYYSVDNNSNIEATKNVTVKIDTTSPIMTIHSPENKTYHTKTIPLNFTANEPLDTCLLSVDQWRAGPPSISGTRNNLYL